MSRSSSNSNTICKTSSSAIKILNYTRSHHQRIDTFTHARKVLPNLHVTPTRRNTLSMASSVATSGQGSGCSFHHLSLELRRMIYRLIFPTEAEGLPDMAEKSSYLNLLFTNSEIYTDASFFFYSETTFLMEISMSQIYFLGESYYDEKPFLPGEKLYQRIQNLRIEINWKFNAYVGRMGSIGSIEKAAAKMQKNLEGVCSALASFVRLKSIEIECYSKRIPPSGGGPDTSIPGPPLTRDLLRPFELLQAKKPTTQIWVTDIENLTGQDPQGDELDCKPLKTTVADIAYQSRGRSGPGYLA